MGTRDISNCSFNLSLSSSNFRSFASEIACRVILFIYYTREKGCKKEDEQKGRKERKKSKNINFLLIVEN
jgi:hypothetical protein